MSFNELALSGLKLADGADASKRIDTTLQKGDSATLVYDFEALRTGKVVATYLRFDSDAAADGTVNFTLGVGERNVALSPDAVRGFLLDLYGGDTVDDGFDQLLRTTNAGSALAGAFAAELELDYHRIGDFPGAFFANAVDVDHDEDLDVFVVSAFNDWANPEAQSMVWFENDGSMGFVLHDLTSTPTHLLVLAHGDMDGDGWEDFVTGGMYPYPPFDRMSRITLWRNRWPERRVAEQ